MQKFQVTLMPSPEAQEETGLAEGEKRSLDMPDDESTALVIDGWRFSDWRWCAISGGTAVFLHDTEPQRVGEE